LRTSRSATWTPSSLPLGSPPLTPRDRVVPERVAVVSLVMAHLLVGIGLQLNGQLPVRVEQPAMTRFEAGAAIAAAERGKETTDS
jgi:hypothetical protein